MLGNSNLQGTPCERGSSFLPCLLRIHVGLGARKKKQFPPQHRLDHMEAITMPAALAAPSSPGQHRAKLDMSGIPYWNFLHMACCCGDVTGLVFKQHLFKFPSKKCEKVRKSEICCVVVWSGISQNVRCLHFAMSVFQDLKPLGSFSARKSGSKSLIPWIYIHNRNNPSNLFHDPSANAAFTKNASIENVASIISAL